MEDIQDLLKDLRARLHACPEPSGKEVETLKILKNFLRKHTGLSIHDEDGWFYAAHREPGAQRGIAFRGDIDALDDGKGGANHLCGHDGHGAALCGLGLLMEGKVLSANVFLIFQPAEEIGTGAVQCAKIFELEDISEIYGAHNLPGLPLGEVFTTPGTFACGSRGLTLKFIGKPAHAAYPELGISPASAIARVLDTVPQLIEGDNYPGITLCTVVGARLGERTFGTAAWSGEVWLTLRAEHDASLHKLLSELLSRCHQLAASFSLEFSAESHDVFPATENHNTCAEYVLSCTGGSLLPEPMRWSEDFGHYLHKCPGAFFGIGAGIDHPPLHSENYTYPDDLLLPTAQAFFSLI